MEWITRVSWVDLLIVIIVLRGTYVGSQRGFLGELFHIFGICLAIVLGIHFYTPISNFSHTYIFIPLNIAYIISFLLITFVIYVVFKTIYTFLQKLLKIEMLPAINKIGGAFIGFCKSFVLSVFIVLIMLLVPIRYISESVKTESLFAPAFIEAGAALYVRSSSIFSAVKSEDLRRLLNGIEPLKFNGLRLKRKDKLDEILQ